MSLRWGQYGQQSMSSPAARSAQGLAGRDVPCPHDGEPIRNAALSLDAVRGLAQHQPAIAPPVPFRGGAHAFPPRSARGCISAVARVRSPPNADARTVRSRVGPARGLSLQARGRWFGQRCHFRAELGASATELGTNQSD
jgi:hypothetical protein